MEFLDVIILKENIVNKRIFHLISSTCLLVVHVCRRSRHGNEMSYSICCVVTYINRIVDQIYHSLMGSDQWFNFIKFVEINRIPYTL